MKRVRAACILQTLVFSQRPELGLSAERSLAINRDEVESYKSSLERTHTKYQITGQTELENGSIVLHVKKQYSDKADVSEYFD